MFRDFHEAAAQWAADKPMHERNGIYMPDVRAYAYDAAKDDYTVAMDAQPTLQTDPNSSIPYFLTTMVDPTIIEILFAPTVAAEIAGEVRRGTWLDQQIMFPVVESTGEVSSYGDYATSGMSSANMDFPQRQAYLFQTIKRYGELELERAGLAKVNWIQQLDRSAANNLNRFSNFTYFYGVLGLQNYGLFNDPNLGASITPAAKAYGGTTWISSGTVRATANEIFLDVEDLVIQLVGQNQGLVNTKSKMTLALSPANEAAFSTTNSFGVNVNMLIKQNYPNMRIITAPQYAVQSALNPQGLAAGNFMQLFVDEVEGQQTVFCAFNEKMRAHPIIRQLSAFEQKMTAGTWGAVYRYPAGEASMLGI